MGNPEQTSDIGCYREMGYCIEATAIISRGFGGPHMSLDTDLYEIERWDDQELVTKPLQFGCVRYIRRFNRTQKSVTGLRSTTSTDDACKALDNAEKYLELKDGFDVTWPLEQNKQRNFRQLMQLSPSLIKLLDANKGK